MSRNKQSSEQTPERNLPVWVKKLARWFGLGQNHSIQIGNITNSVGVAIGNGASVSINYYEAYHPGAPFQAPPLPPWFVSRPDASDPLLAALLNAESPHGALLISAMHGLGGIGKTTLASFLAHQKAIAERFPDGVLWVTLGQKPDVLTWVHAWIQAMGDYYFKPLTIESAETHIRTLLKNKACLLIIDDVWHAEDVQPFLNGGEKCRVIITTRDASIANKLGASLHSLDILTPEQSFALIIARLGEMSESDHSYAAALAKRLGYHPLAIEQATGRIQEGYPWIALLSYFDEKLTRLERLNLHEPEHRNESLRLCFQASLDTLHPVEQEAFAWLGVLHYNARINPQLAGVLWQIPIDEAIDRLERWRKKALLKEIGNGLYTLHDLLHDEARLRLISDQTWEQSQRTFLERLKTQTKDGFWYTLSDDEYSHQHLSWHLMEAGQIDALRGLISEETIDGRNGWCAACSRLGQLRSFIADVHTCWQICKLDVGQSVRCALIITSFNSLAKNYPEELIETLLKLGWWNSEQSLVYANQKVDEASRSAILAVIAPYLPHELLKEALTTALKIKDERYGPRAVSAIASHLPPNEALIVIRSIKNERYCSQAISAVAPYLPPKLLAEALSVAHSIKNEYFRSVALAAITPHLASDLQVAIANEVRSISQGIDNRFYRLDPLAAIIPYLEPELQGPTALEGILGSMDYSSLLQLPYPLNYTDNSFDIEYIPFSEIRSIIVSRSSLADILTSVRSIKGEYDHSRFMAAITPYMPFFLRDGFLDEVHRIKGECDRSRALAAIAPHLPPDIQLSIRDEALSVARNIRDEYSRAKVLATITSCLPSDLQASVLNEALATTRSIKDEYNRSKVLVVIVSHLPSGPPISVLNDVLEIARGFENIRYRAKSLAIIVPYLSLETQSAVLNEALSIVQDIEDEYSQSKTLAAMIPYLVPELQADVAAKALALSTFSLSHNMSGDYTDIKYSSYSEFLSAITPHLSPELLDETLTIARKIIGEYDRTQSLVAIVPHLRSDLQSSVCYDALSTARNIKDEYNRSKALVAVASCSPSSLKASRWRYGEKRRRKIASCSPSSLKVSVLDEALATARSIKDRYRSTALIAVATQLPHDLQEPVIFEALIAAKSIEDEYERFEALANAMPHLPPLDGVIFAMNGESIAKSIINELVVKNKGNDKFWQTLATFASSLPLELNDLQTHFVGIVLAGAKTIQDKSYSAQILAAIFHHLPPDMQKTLFNDTFKAIRDIKDTNARFEALSAIASYLLAQPDSVQLWSETLLIIASRARFDLLSDLAALTPWIASFGEEAVHETVQAIQDVGRWWQ